MERGEAVVCRVEDGEYDGVREEDIYSGDSKVARGALKRIVKALAVAPVGFSDGTQATVSGRTREEVQHHMADRRVVAALARVRELAARGVYLYSAENEERGVRASKQDIVGYHYYFAKGEFPVQAGGEAYVCIAVSEYVNGQRVYDITLADVADVEQNKEEAQFLPTGRISIPDKEEGNPRQATRVSNPGQVGIPFMGRIQETRRYVNYIDRVSQEKGGEQLFGNSEQVEGGDVSMSVRNLAAVHTISYENFIEAGDKLGGMPLPSVAVTRLDRPYDWGSYADVTLVARPDMVDPRRGTDVYARDAWTGRMPRIESETLADGSEYRYFYDEDGEEVEATLENLTDYLYDRKRRGNEATEREMDLVLTAKAYLARRMKDMEEVKGQRERLQEREEESVGSWVIGSWMDMLHKYDVWLGDEEWIGVFEALADLEEVTEEGVREAIMGWTDADGRADLSALQNSEAMEEGSRFIKEAVRILRKLRAEKTDYLEAVPRREVKMNEWVYALFSEKIPDKDEVRRVCRENGIVPVEYKAGERDKALGDLIDDAEVSFSVIGEHARTWGKYKERAFAGRDDGRMRAEIDASKARLTGALSEVKKAAIERVWERAERDKNWHSWMSRGAVADELENDPGASMPLMEALKYDELYEAYPELSEMRVSLRLPEDRREAGAWYDPERREIFLNVERTEKQWREKLLHEVQHAIQEIEGFARGGSPEAAGSMEDYRRYAGEVEARNVQRRADFSPWMRENLPFNATLDPGEAIVSFSVTEARERGLMRDGAMGVEEKLPDESDLTIFEVDGELGENVEGALRRGKGSGEWRRDREVRLSNLPDVLRYLGEPDVPLMMTVYHIRKVVNGHLLGVDELMGAVGALNDAVMVVREADGTYLFLLDEEAKGKDGEGAPIVGVIRQKGGREDARHAVSFYALDEGKEGKFRGQFRRLVYCRQKGTAMHAADAPRSRRALELLRAAIDGGYADSVASREDVVKRKDGWGGDMSGSMVEGGLEGRVMAIMRGDVAEAEGMAVAEEWGRFLRAFSLESVGEDERDAGRMLGRMLALVAATRRVLPENFKGGGNGLGLQAAWLRWYAQMAETGQVTKSSELSGVVYDRIRDRLMQEDEMRRLNYTEGEAIEMLKGYAGQKMGAVVESMARGCRRLLETYLKEKMRQDMLGAIERLYPKREPGEYWKRGRATGETYRYAEVVKDLLMHGYRALLPSEEHEAEVKKCERVLAKGNISNHTRETYERRLENLRRKEENALYQEVEKLEGVLEDAEASEEEREEARERMFFLTTFGGWNSKDYKEAASVKEQFDRVIKEGRRVWAERMKERKAQVDLYKSRVRATRGWRRVGVLGEAIVERTKKGDSLKAKTRGFALGLTNMAGKLNAYKRELGTYFVSEMLGDLADIHVNLKRKQDEMLGRVMDILARASGRRNVENLSQWVRDNNVMERTGIMITQPQSFRVTYTKEQIDKYLAMTSEEREELRRTKAERELKAGRTLEPVPSDGELEELREQVVESEVNGLGRENFEVVIRVDNPEEIVATKWGLLQILLTAEQPYYEDLLAANGLNMVVLAQIREYVGADLLAAGYELREILAEMRPYMAEQQERLYGIPMAEHEKYWPGRFFIESGAGGAQENGKAEKKGGALAMRPSSLRPRQVHKRKIAYNRSALDVFYGEIADEINWLTSGEYMSRWASLLLDKDFNLELEANCSKEFLDGVKEDLQVIGGAALADRANMQGFEQLVSAYAKWMSAAHLAWNPNTVAKNAASVINGWIGGYVPTKVFADNAGVLHALEEKEVNLLTWLAGMSGEIGLKDVFGQDFIQVRYKVPKKVWEGVADFLATEGKWLFEGSAGDVRAAAGEGAMVKGWRTKVQGSKLNRALAILGKKFVELGMKPIEAVDVVGNVVGGMMLANAVYKGIEKQDTGGVFTAEQKKQLALDYVKRAFDAVAQPFINSQKVTQASHKGFAGGLTDVLLYLFRSEQNAKFSKMMSDMIAGGVQRWTSPLLYAMNGIAANTLSIVSMYGLGMMWWLLAGEEPKEVFNDDFWRKYLWSLASDYPIPFWESVLTAFDDTFGWGLAPRSFNDPTTVPVLGIVPAWKRVQRAQGRGRGRRVRSYAAMMRAVGSVGVMAPMARPLNGFFEAAVAFAAANNFMSKPASRARK